MPVATLHSDKQLHYFHESNVKNATDRCFSRFRVGLNTKQPNIKYLHIVIVWHQILPDVTMYFTLHIGNTSELSGFKSFAIGPSSSI